MSGTERVIRGRRVLAGEAPAPAALHLAGGRIARVAPFDDVPPGAPCVEAGERLVTAGLVDAHVHVNEPGRAEWEGFANATAAAAAGGVTTIVDMPLNAIPPTTTRAGLEAKRRAIAGVAHVDVACWGGLVPGPLDALADLAAGGVAGFKCFLCPSGVPEFPPVDAGLLDEALPRLRALDRPLLVHAESPAALARAPANGDPRRHGTWLAARSPAAEEEAVAMLIERCRRHRAPVHVVHVSSAGAVERIARARAEGLPLTAEACPHHLTFAAEEVPDGATEFKCAPPIRERAHREALWRGLADGALDLIASDHSPCPPALKARATGDFLAAWGGIAGLQLLLPAAWTAARGRGHPVRAVLGWCAERPARLAGLDDRKGRLAPGGDADLVVWDDAGTFTVDPAALLHRHPLTPYAGRVLHGLVHETWLRGRLAWSRESGLAPPAGEFVARC